MYNYPKYGTPSKQGSRYFYYHNPGLANQSILYMQESLEAEPEVFLVSVQSSAVAEAEVRTLTRCRMMALWR